MPYKPLMPVEKVGARREFGGGKPQKYFLDDRGRRLIMDLYDGTKERLNMLQRHLPGIPRPVICRWAMQLGKVHPRDRWTKEEEKFLRHNIRTMPMYKIADHLGKDSKTIARKATFLGLYKKGMEDGYSLNALGEALGVYDDAKMQRWIRNGWLKGKKVTTEINQKSWYFTDKDIRAFIIAHPDEVDPRRFDWLWVIDVLMGDRGIGRLDNPVKGE